MKQLTDKLPKMPQITLPPQVQMVFDKIKYAFESLSLLQSMIIPQISAKIPAQFKKYMTPVLGGIYFLLHVWLWIFPIFMSSAYKTFMKGFRKTDAYDYIGLINGVSWLLVLVPLFIVIGSAVWRSQRDKTFGEIQKKFAENKTTIILRPRGDDKNKWRESYNGFWSSIHRNFKTSENDVLKQNTPYASFEIHRFGPWLRKNSRPDFAVAVTIDKELLNNVLYQLQSLHSDMTAETPDKDLLDGLKTEEGATVMYQDFAPGAGTLKVLNTDTTQDQFRTLSAIVTNLTTGIYAVGVQVLVRDGLNAMAELNDYVAGMTTSADGKRKSLDKMGKNQVDALETKKMYASESITYDIVLRLYVIGKQEDEMKQTMAGLIEWTRQLGGSNQFVKISEGSDMETLVNRVYPSKTKGINSITPIELSPIWHIPDVADSIALLARASFKILPPPQSAILQPGDAARVLGYFKTANGEKLNVGVRQKGDNPDICYHTYIVGPTGVGKSVSLQNQIVADMNCIQDQTKKPFSVIVLEPHEDLTKDILIRVPEEREGDVVVIDPTDHWPIGINMMATSGRAEDVEADSYTVLGIFGKVMGSMWDSAPRMKRFMGNAVKTIMTVLPKTKEIPTVLHLQAFMSNIAYRESVVSQLTAEDGLLVNEWMTFGMKSEGEQASTLDPAITRINTFLGNQILRRVIAQPKMSLNFRELMDNGSIILAKMHNKMGDDNRALLGSLIVSFIFKAAMGRGEIEDKNYRQTTGFYIDEFQTMVAGTGGDIKSILAEARKMRLAMTLANQYFEQLPSDVQDAIQNCGTKIVFRQEPKGARLFEPIFANKLISSDFVGLERYMAHVRLMSFGNPTQVTLNLYPGPPIPASAKLEPNNRNLVADTAEALGMTVFTDESPEGATNAESMLTWYMDHRDQALNDSSLHSRFVRMLIACSDDVFREYQELRDVWCKKEREILLRDKSYMVDKVKRVAHLSRLKVGVPGVEIDALLGRLNNKMQALMSSRKENSGNNVDENAIDFGENKGDDDDMFSFSGSKKGGKGGNKGNKKEAPAGMDDFFG